MEIQRPLAVVTPTLDGDVLAALAGAQAWFTTGQLHRIITGRSLQGIRLALQRLVEQGIVDSERVGQTMRYRLNRDHLAAPAVTSLANQRGELLRRIESQFGGWTIPPVYAAVFGSAGRGHMRIDSDIDIFVVRGADIDEQLWDHQIAELARMVTRWTGNDGRVLEMTESEVAAGATSDPALRSISREGLTVFGQPTWLRKQLAGKPARHAKK